MNKKKERIVLNQLKVKKNFETSSLTKADELQTSSNPSLYQEKLNQQLNANNGNTIVMIKLLQTLAKLNQNISCLTSNAKEERINIQRLNQNKTCQRQIKNQRMVKYSKEKCQQGKNKNQSSLEIHPKDVIVKARLFLQSSQEVDVKQMKKFFVQAIDQILSSGFNLYLNDTFSKNQAKAFCTKNILLNIKQLLQKGQNWTNPLQQMQKINEVIKNIILANLKKYPQKALVAASQRIKEVIPTTNLLQSDEYDFLYLNRIAIKNKKEKKYFSQIMKAINTMIETPTQLIHKNSESTIFDIFKLILTMMTTYSTQECFKAQQKNITQSINLSQLVTEKKITKYSYHVKELIYLQLMEKLKKQIQQVQTTEIVTQMFDFWSTKNQKNSQNIFKTFDLKKKQSTFSKNEEKEEISRIKQNKHKNLIQIKQRYQSYFDQPKIKNKLKNLFINTKLSSKVKKYTKQEIQSGRFQIKDSNILRILSKWTQQLEDKFFNPNQKIFKRTQKFKTNSFQFIDLQDMEKNQNQIYYQLFNYFQISKANCIDDFVNRMQQQNFKHQYIFGQLICSGEYVKDQTANVGVFSSKMQKIAGSYIANYLNCLISQLTMIPLDLIQDSIFKRLNQQKKEIYNEQTRQKIKNINLVTLKIGDLMRGKYTCNQNQFIRFVNILQVFSKQNPNILKIIRVKNRIESKDNDILINLLFMKKVQCQFQLSISNDSNSEVSKQKKTNQFNHYLYEISRNSLGPISELAGILIQQDPLISQYFTKDDQNLNEKVQFLNEINFEKYQNIINSSNKNQNIKEFVSFLPFACRICKTITSNFNNLMDEQINQKVCLECFVKKYLKLNEQQNSTIGYQLMKKIWSLNNKQNQSNSKQQQQDKFKAENYEQYVEFFDYTNKKTFQDSYNLQKFNSKIPSFGYYLDFHQNKPQFRIFVKQFFNQKIVLFKINQVQRKKKLNLISKEQLENFQAAKNKTDVIGIFQFKDSKKEKSWIKAIPKNYLLWGDKTFSGFSSQILNDFNKNLLMKDQIQFIEKFIQCQQLKNQKLAYQNILQDQINQNYMKNVVKQRRSQININRFAKVNDKIFQKIFSHYKKQALLIKEFRVNQAIKVDQEYSNKNWIRELKSVEILHLESNKIQQISFLSDLKHIKNLDLQNNLIKDTKNLQNLQNLNNLNLNQNFLQMFISMPHMNFLSHLYLSQNKLQRIDLSNAWNLKVLDLSKNQLTSQNLQSFQKLQVLTQLNFSSNYLEDCNFLSKNTQLRQLKLSQNKLKQVKSLKVLCKLSILNLKQNEIFSIDGLQYLKQLQQLYLEKNQIANIQCLSGMIKLKFLNLSQNKIQEVQQLKNMLKLSQLILNYNPVKKIGILENMPSLTKLNLRKLAIQSIIALRLSFLESLDLSINKLENVEFLKQLPKLQDLNLYENMITSIYPVGKLKSLQTLNVSLNKIEDISPLCQLQKLTELCISNNKVMNLPEQLHQMKALLYLDLSYNHIPYPNALKRCHDLKQLSLNGCNLIDTYFLTTLSKLTSLNLQFNNIRDINGLRHLNSLTTLRLKNNQIEKIQPISKLMCLNHLQAQCNKINDAETLISLSRCMRIFLTGNQIIKEKQEQLRTKLRNRGVMIMF